MRAIKIFSIAILLLGCNKSYSSIHVIKQSGTSFSPSNITVIVGDTVRWEWSAGSHTTTSKVIPNGAEAWDSPLTSTSTSFEYKVTVEGTYNYVCTPHESLGMKGSFTANVTNAINENSPLLNFTIYPNPASSFINITTDINGEVVLSDILGKNLRNIRLNELSVIADTYRLDLLDLKNGIYIVTLIPSDSKKRISLKFMKE
ncbi:MAG: hypothetical protein A2W97_07135 [Bacteroidetes bacterium GWE2_40_63]|nr:MAG: hypothetical protein A2W95_16880 [Bacteroidetes bacterium GWA2_40_14]OFX56678.1 MAG: hypothetical protein A2W84_07330 [Bacteroidetes bacterium GWC2_40_13]OFX72415.1 MAG: hypothetical protein A2W96_05145 [Bacteroidetes bacterium GWD2_40_43]OFX95308.1 MAG: hypothetical protein A2W97_07135 [Bacteroidetes bacterium GWE2_40_63]OFY21860.1 MAG: hypothetical protein A2W88_13180 [Bacteroidetes bacterium GWF2_40_13]OFZ26130.1 MAG: hypothetical protein A2437_02270 [Bacteroidetes bacterium RIFOXYC